MAPTSSAMELKVLISVLQQGNLLQNMLSQVNQLSTALTALQNKVNQAGGSGPVIPPIAPALKEGEKAADDAANALKRLDGVVNTVTRAVRFMTGGFLALQGVRLLKDLADTAARAQVLETVLHVVANNAGVTAEEIDKVDKQVQKLGITAASSRESLTQFLQGRLDLKFAPQLARAAQDLAVISGKDSSQTFSRLITNIQQLDTLGLRWMGLIVDRTKAEEKYKEKIDATTRALSKREQQSALMEEVLVKAQQLEGAYANAMNDAGKQMTSLERLTTTYKQTLGEALLPAYSVIIAKITEMFEKLTILARAFSANKERSAELAKAADELASIFTNIAVFLMEHLDTIIKLVKWYIELKLAIFAFKGIVIYFTWIVTIIEWVLKARLAFQAWQAGMVTFRAAMTAMGAASVAQTAQMLQLAAAQTTVATSTQLMLPGFAATTTAATATTAAVSGLTTAWIALGAALAVPVIGFIIYKIKQEYDRQSEQTPMQRAVELRDSQRGFMSWFQGSAIKEMNAASLALYFEEWKKRNPELVASLKTDIALWEEFNRQLDETKKSMNQAEITNPLIEKLSKARQEYQMAVTALTELKHPAEGTPKATGEERQLAEQRVQEASDRIKAVQKELGESFKPEVSSNITKDLFKQIDLVGELTRKVGEVQRNPNRTPQMLADANAALEVAKVQRDAMLTTFDTQLAADKTLTDEQRRADKAAAQLKLDIQQAADMGEALTEAKKQLFGEKFQFTDEGVTSGAFGQAFGGYTTLLTEGKKILDDTGEIPRELADQLRKGLEELGRAAKTPLDLQRLRGIQEQLQAFEKVAPGVGAKFRQQVEVARLGVQAESMQAAAPLVAESKAQAKLRSDALIQEAQRYYDRLKTLKASEAEAQEALYREGLVGLNAYYAERMRRVQEEGAAEARVQSEQIASLLVQKAKTDPKDQKTLDELQIQINRARSQLATIFGQTENRLDQERNARDARLRQLQREAQGGALGIRAQQGGAEEQLRQLDFQLEAEKRKFGELSDTQAKADAEAYLNLKRLVETAEIYRKAREAAYQAELNVERSLQNQLDLQEKAVGAARSRVQAGVARGDITEAEGMALQNSLTLDQMQLNRERRASKERELATQRNRFDTETLALAKELANPDLGLSVEERNRRIVAAQQQWTQEIQNTEGAIMDLDVAYQDLANNVESYGQRIKQSFINNFADALTQSITNFRNAGKVWISLAQSLANEIVSVFARAFAQRLFRNISFSFIDRLLGTRGSFSPVSVGDVIPGTPGVANAAEGGLVSGPGTGTSDSIPAMVSAGEHIMPASKTAQFLPLLEGIRTGKILPFARGGVVQSIAISPLIPRHYAGGGVVTSDAGAANVMPGGGGGGSMMVTLHPETMNMTMREWLEHEVARQHSRR